MKIRIYLDGTFESLSAAKTLTPVEKRAKIKALQADLKTIKKVEALRVTREAAKKAGNKEKDKDLLAKIKALKASLSSNRNSSSEIVSKFIRAVMDMPTGAAKTIAQLDKESKAPVGKKAPIKSPAGKKVAAKQAVQRSKEPADPTKKRTTFTPIEKKMRRAIGGALTYGDAVTNGDLKHLKYKRYANRIDLITPDMHTSVDSQTAKQLGVSLDDFEKHLEEFSAGKHTVKRAKKRSFSPYD